MNSEVKNKLYEWIKQADNRHMDVPRFKELLSSIWDTYSLPATEDYRFRHLGDEIDKHYFDNDDWTQDKLYKSKLHILDNDDKLLSFICGLLGLDGVGDNKELVQQLNLIAQDEDLLFYEDDGKWQVEKIGDSIPVEEDKSLIFIRCQSTIQRYVDFIEDNIELPKEERCFVLTYNYRWDDYDYRTWYCLYYKEGTSLTPIGTLKIMFAGENKTEKKIPQRFTKLDNQFCSLGCDVSYYKKMYHLFGTNAKIYLGELRDAAFYMSIQEKFDSDIIFRKSLLRLNSSERALREGKIWASGQSMKDAYSFVYHYEPSYDTEKLYPRDIKFEFKYACSPYQRIIGLIGENGVGKSTLLNKLIESIIRKDKKSFVGEKIPIFSQLMVMSYSPFDKFPSFQEDFTVKYRYCGLLNPKGELQSKQSQISHFKDNLEMIAKRNCTLDSILQKWKEVMAEVIPEDTLNSFYDENEKLNHAAIDKFCQNMSSGESIFVYSLTDIIANIRYDTLILFDEPEQHLHPHAITTLVTAIYEVLEMFDSYAIIATHSPFIIRELISDNVYTMEREDNMLMVAKIGIESFGEDVSVLSDIIFKDMAKEKRYEYFLEKVAKDYKYNYQEILSAIKGMHNPLGLNVRLLIRSIVDKHNNHA